MNSAACIIAHLKLIRHDEGGWFRETYRAAKTVKCYDREGGIRPLLTIIYYLLEAATPRGVLHQNRSDIVHFYQGGGLLRYVMLHPDGQLTESLIGPGHELQFTVPGGVWKASELIDGDWSLVGEAISPGFDYRDRMLAERNAILAQYPNHVTALAPFLPQSRLVS